MCRGVRYSVTGEPLRVGICHCTDCRQSSGSAFAFFAIWPIDAFAAEGPTTSYEGRSFCPTCGSRVFAFSAGEAEIMVGSLDEAPSGQLPGYELWTTRREEWLQALPWADQFERDREP
jgi:hypothetical protein